MIARTVVAVLAVAMTLPAAAETRTPVTIDSDGKAAACMIGHVSGLNPRGDNFLAVRTGPDTGTRKVDELHTGDRVFLCDKRGKWWGAVYGPGDCGVFAATNGPTPYRGPCRSGWIFERFVTVADVG
jgi:hypothetical protein